ncbi:MAG: hypothetical protein BGO69_12635 [Bacteroidetes bacterium 46-16]|nr:MAG: hypothetical protein BGO69_12635 [Bacteroidetes bacterium 46-16]
MAETRIRLDKQIQKAPAVNMVPLSDANGELQFANIGGLIKTGETVTRLNSVEITGGDLVIKYTAEDGNQQVVSTKLAINQTDINVADAKLENSSSGVYRLIITETDGSTYPVDLSALLAVVAQNTQDVTLTGNGTPQNPLRADLTADFWTKVPRNLDAMDDVYVPDLIIAQEVSKGGTVVLVWDYEMRQWIPKSSRSLDSYYEVTETFPELRAGDRVFLQINTSQIVNGSIKVYRNGLRQAYGIDYDFGKQGEPNSIQFYVPFTDKFPETVIVDYRPASF